ncbi:MAG: DUF1573 domain-containing protein [Bacteroidota bacterium]
MRNFIYRFSIVLFVMLAILISCNYEGRKDEQNSISDTRRINKNIVTEIEFISKEFDFGTITSGENVSHRFKFKNTGSSNLYITKVVADCGCTVIDYKKEAVMPGQESYIEAVFNSTGYHGLQIKNIKVHSNTKPAENELVIAATIDASTM